MEDSSTSTLRHPSPLMIWVYNMGLMEGIMRAIGAVESEPSYKCWMCPAEHSDAAAFLIHIRGCDKEQRSRRSESGFVLAFQKTANTV